MIPNPNPTGNDKVADRESTLMLFLYGVLGARTFCCSVSYLVISQPPGPGAAVRGFAVVHSAVAAAEVKRERERERRVAFFHLVTLYFPIFISLTHSFCFLKFRFNSFTFPPSPLFSSFLLNQISFNGLCPPLTSSLMHIR